MEPLIQNPLIDLTTYNNKNKNIPCEIKQKATMPYMDPDGQMYMSVVRFDFNNDLCPVFIPKIRTDNSFAQQYEALMISKGYTKQGSTYNSTLDSDSTDLFIAIENDDQNYFACGYVQWKPVNINAVKPTPQEASNRGVVLESPYYHCYNTMHVSTLVETLITQLLTSSFPLLGLDSFLVKDDYGYNLLIEKGSLANLNSMNVVMSTNLWRMYPFVSVPHDFMDFAKTLIFKKPQVVQYDGAAYFQIPTQYKSTSFLPFRTISMKTHSIPIESQLTGNNMFNESKNENKIVTDFLMSTVNDPDKMYDVFSFVPDSNNFRPVMLKNARQQYELDFYFTMDTSDGYSVPIYLEPGRYASVKVDINPGQA